MVGCCSLILQLFPDKHFYHNLMNILSINAFKIVVLKLLNAITTYINKLKSMIRMYSNYIGKHLDN